MGRTEICDGWWAMGSHIAITQITHNLCELFTWHSVYYSIPESPRELELGIHRIGKAELQRGNGMGPGGVGSWNPISTDRKVQARRNGKQNRMQRRGFWRGIWDRMWSRFAYAALRRSQATFCGKCMGNGRLANRWVNTSWMTQKQSNRLLWNNKYYLVWT